MVRLCMRLFGTYHVTLDGETVSGFASDKVRALLAYLVVEADQPQRREKLAGLLWPDFPDTLAHGNLRAALANLRTVIGDRASMQARSEAHPYLLISRQTIRFNRAADAWIDVLSFAERSDRATLASLDQASRLYTGDFLEGFSLGDASLFEEWALLNRERYRRLAMGALHRLADGYGRRGDYERALAHAWRQVEMDPWQETAHQQLMRLLTLSGCRSDALIQYETCCRLLAEELGVAPTQTTVALYDQIRSGQLAAPEHPSPRARERAVDPAPFLGHDEPAHAERPAFVARDDELARLDACLDLVMAGQGRVFFICGEAGSGKTALMAEFARRAMEAHPNLIVANGECSAYSGFGDSYLPIRSILAMLTGDVHIPWAAGSIRPRQARRLYEAIQPTIEALLERGPQVLDVLLQGEPLLSRASLVGHDNDPWLRRLREWVRRPRNPLERMDESQLFQQTTNVLREIARTHSLLLIIDDLQWADTASTSLLFHLGRRLHGSQILVLAAYRPAEVGQQRGAEPHSVQQLQAELRRTYGDVCLDLDQIEEARCRAFVDAFLDLEPNRLGESFRGVLLKHTTGHPLFTIELLRAMQERGELLLDEAGRWTAGPAPDWTSLPARVEGVIEERLGRLDEELGDILTVACVEGESFTVQVLARLLNTDEGRLLRMLSRQLQRRHRLVRWLGELEVGEQRLLRYRFAHALFQQYLYMALSPGERQLLHSRIAAILEELYLGHGEDIAPQLVWHYSEAGDGRNALRYLTLVADTALASYAGDDAETSYRRALELAPEGAQRAHLLEGLGRALARQSHFTEALQPWREAIELSQLLDDLEGVARLYARSSSAAWWSGDSELGLRLCQEGLRATATAPECPGTARLLHEAARSYYFAGSSEQAGTLCRQALEMAERLGVVDVQADALTTLAGLPGQAAQAALEMFARAVQLAENANLPGIAFRAHNNLAVVKAMVYGPQASCEELEHAVQLSQQSGHVAHEILALGNLVEGWLALGDLEQALDCLSRMRRLASELDDPGSSAERICRLEAAALLYQGEWLKAVPLLRHCQAVERRQNNLQGLLNTDLGLARALLELYSLGNSPGRHDWNEAERTLAEAIEIGQAMGDTDQMVLARSYLAMLHLGRDQLEQARDLLSEAQGVASDWPFPPTEAPVLWAQARLAAAEERWTEALGAFESLVDTYAQFGMRWDRARTLVDWAGAYASRGEAADFGRARSLLQESHAMFQEMGVPRYARLVEERLNVLPSPA